MEFTLLTYDSTLALNAGYSGSANAVAFQETLARLVDTFSEYSGVEKKDIYWLEVTNSDWCNNMLILYAKVGADWQPRKDTWLVDEGISPYFPNLAKGFYQWVKGNGEYVDISAWPPETPHPLFRTVKNAL